MTRDISHIGKQITFNDQHGKFPHTMLQPGDLLVFGDTLGHEFQGPPRAATLQNIESLNKNITSISSLIVGSFVGWTKSSTKGLVELTSISSNDKINTEYSFGWKRDNDVPSYYKSVTNGLDRYWHISEGETWTLVGYVDGEVSAEKEYEVSLVFLKEGYKQAPQEIKEKLLAKFKAALNAEKEYFSFGRNLELTTGTTPLMIANCYADPEIGPFKELIVLDGYEVIVSELGGRTRIKFLKKY